MFQQKGQWKHRGLRWLDLSWAQEVCGSNPRAPTMLLQLSQINPVPIGTRQWQPFLGESVEKRLVITGRSPASATVWAREGVRLSSVYGMPSGNPIRFPPYSAEERAVLFHASLASICSQRRRRRSAHVPFTGWLATQNRRCPQYARSFSQ